MPNFGRKGLFVAALFSAAVVALPTITRSGRYLYSADGSRFYIKGVAYQQQGQESTDVNNPFLEPATYIDPLADSAGCTRDVPYLQQLGVNTIRVYSVDNTQNHDSCMSALSAAGIYTIIDLSLPVNGSIDRASPAWTTNLLDLYIETIDAFSGYNNVLGYNVGNEVVVESNDTSPATFVKAAARDIKAYLKSKSSSALVGYAAIDADATWLDPLANYLSCDPSNGDSGDTAIDLFGLNDYEWCGNAPNTTYDNTNGQFAGYNVAAYFSEYGCVSTTPRVWTEVATLFASPMTDIWSGGIAFSYFPATSSAGQFGMVTISGNTVTPSTDFTNLKTQYGQTSPPNSPSQSSESNTYPSCPTTNDTWAASTTLPPTPNDAACQCLENELSCRFTPASGENSTAINDITGTLLDYTCSLLGQTGGNCNDIAANGTTGSYGRVSFCSPKDKLSYVMSQYYESQNHNSQACSFSGNATINTGASSAAGAAGSAALSCLSNPSATFVPSSPAGGPSSTGTSGKSGSASLMVNLQSLAVVLAFGTVGAMWTFMA